MKNLNEATKDNNKFHLPKLELRAKKSETLDDDFGFFSQEFFREMLVLERKRTERSKKPIMLVMLHIQNLTPLISRHSFVKNMSHVITNSAREIDVKGWYEFDRCIGIIYTEISESGKDNVVKKILDNIKKSFGQEKGNLVDVTYSIFPQPKKQNGDDTDPASEVNFYPSSINVLQTKTGARFLKRFEDIIGSSLLIIIFSPIFIATAALIKLSSKGPVFFTQNRIGFGGKPFKFIKFRSMYVNNDPSIHKEYVKKLISGKAEIAGTGTDVVYKLVDDPRVTKIGKFIRKTSIDELPQFFNVLMGNMSLVGPRPPIQYELENYHIWHKRRVYEIKPGITGYWQVSGRSKTTFDTMVRMDLQYIRKWSLWWDVLLILSTPIAVFKGAY